MEKHTLKLISRYRTEIMGFAALWILFYHEWRSVFGNSVLGKAERFIAEMGFYGVDFFLFLSGMGLVYAIQKHSLTEFYRRRFGKLLVPYVLTLTICVFFQGWDPLHFLGVFTSWNFWMVDMYTTPWYLYAILVLYLLFPCYYALFRRASRKGLFTAGVLAVWFVFSNALNGILRMDLYGFTNRIPVFLTGVLAGELLSQQKAPVFSGKTWLLCLGALLAGMACYYLTYYRKMFILVPSSECFLPSYLVTVSGACILAQLLSLSDRNAIGRAVRSGLHFLGVMSLEMYCVQYIFLKKVQILLVGKLPDMLINLVNFAVIIAASWGLHRLYGFLTRKLRLI